MKKTQAQICKTEKASAKKDELLILAPKNSGLRKFKKQALELIRNDKSRVLDLRGEDIPQLCEEFSRNGKRAIGLTGEDLFWDYMLKRKKKTKLKIIRKIKWNDKNAMFGKPVLCLLGPKGKTLKDLPKNLKIIMSAKYTNIAKRYLNLLENELGYTFNKIYTRGMSEEGFSEGIANLVIDIVYSGRTINNYGLRIYDKIFESDFVIIGNEASENLI